MATYENHTKNLYWGAIIAGIIMSLIIGLILNMLGAGVGLSILKANQNGLMAISIIGFIWLTLSTLIGNYFAGWIAVYAASPLREKKLTLVHGLLAWSIATLIYFIAASSTLGAAISGTAQLLGRGISSLTQSSAMIAAAGIGNIPEDMQQEIMQQLRTTVQSTISDKELSSSDKNELLDSVKKYLTTSESSEDMKSEARSQLKAVLVNKLDMSESEAEDTITRWQNQYNQMAEDAKEKAKGAAEYTSGIAGGTILGITFLMLMGALGAALGSYRAYKITSSSNV